MPWRIAALVLSVCSALACGDDAVDSGSTPPGGETDPGGDSTQPPGPDPDAPPAATPASTCEAPLDPVDVSDPDRVVGDGSAASCSREALQAAVEAGGVITFDCGGDVTIPIDAAIRLPPDRDVTIDGGERITLDGGRDDGIETRIFELESPDFRATSTTFTLQHITLQNARAPASDFVEEDPGNPECAHGYRDGQGGAIFVRDAILHVFGVAFRNNAASSPGPDTGGGGIYAVGSLEVVVVDSVFDGNEGSNGGGVGLLQSDGIFVNSVFSNNAATGNGANFGGASGCPSFNHDAQGGAGGNGGAIVIDGGSVQRASFCGVRFERNQAGALGTVFRTPNSQRGRTTFERCSFVDNFAEEGGGGIYTQDTELSVLACTFSGNSANGGGGAIRLEQGVHGSTLELVNTTLHDNSVNRALGGALVFDGEGTVQSCTFARNRAVGGFDEAAQAAFFGAAINGGAFTLHNTIFVDNTDTHPWTPMTCRVSSPLPGAANLQWPRKRVGEDGSPSDQDDDPCSTDVRWEDAMLGSLADNGGPTATMMPLDSSPAIGLGQGCPPTDQRGNARPADGCTAGAVEVD